MNVSAAAFATTTADAAEMASRIPAKRHTER